MGCGVMGRRSRVLRLGGEQVTGALCGAGHRWCCARAGLQVWHRDRTDVLLLSWLGARDVLSARVCSVRSAIWWGL